MTTTRAIKRTAKPASKTTTTKALPRKRTTTTPKPDQTFDDGTGRQWTIKRVAEVPDKKFLTGYVNRNIDGLTDFQIADYAMAQRNNMLILGPTGTGKTSFCYAYAALRGLPLYSLSSSAGADPSQFRGRIVPTVDGNFRWQDGPLTDIMRYGGLLLINEINFLPERVASDLFGALDKRRKIELVDHDGEVIYAPDNTLIVGDMNPGYAGTRDLNEALRNRFAVQVEFDYDPTIEAKLVKMPRLLEIAKQLRDRIAAGDFDTPVSTNMLIEFEEISQGLNLPFAVRNFVMHFPQDDRASVKNVFDLNMANLEAELDALANPGKSTAASDVYDDDWNITDEPVSLYTMAELRGMSLADKRYYAKESGIDPEVFKGMKTGELTTLLLGPVGGHPYWTDGQ